MATVVVPCFSVFRRLRSRRPGRLRCRARSRTRGSRIPGATVTAVNPATGASGTGVSGEQGVFSFLGLAPGTYTVKVELTGFKTYVRENVPLQVDTTTQVDAVMTVGELAETVTVTEATPIINPPTRASATS